MDDPSVGDFDGFYELQAELAKRREWWEELARVARDVSSISHEKWHGLAGEAFTEEVFRISEQAQPVCRGIEAWCGLIKQYVATVPELVVPEVTKWKGHREDLQKDLQRVRARSGEFVALDWDTLATEREIARIEGEIDDANHRIRQFGEMRREAEERLTSGIGRLDLDYTAVGEAPEIVPGLNGEGGSASCLLYFLFTDLSSESPEELRRRWDELTDAQRQALIEEDPYIFGNLDGVPIGWRARANGLAIADYVATLDDARRAALSLRDGGAANAAADDETLVPRPADLDVARKIGYLQGLLHIDAESRLTLQYDEFGNKTYIDHAQVVAFDPGTSGIAFYHGEFDGNGDVPDWYDNVAVFVPGAGSDLFSTSGNKYAADLYAHCNATGAATAVIDWQGGRFPQEAQASSRSHADVLNKQLTSFVAAANAPSSRAAWTVIGHSYGGTVVSQAEAGGLSADRVVYVQSAGVGGADIDSFPNTSDSPHYAVYVDGAVHGGGGDASRGAATVGSVDNWPLAEGGGVVRRSGVLDPQTTAFQNIVEVVTGGDVLPGPGSTDGAGGLDPGDDNFVVVTAQMPTKK